MGKGLAEVNVVGGRVLTHDVGAERPDGLPLRRYLGIAYRMVSLAPRPFGGECRTVSRGPFSCHITLQHEGIALAGLG